MRITLRLLVASLGLVGGVTTAEAQAKPQTREGFWIGFGFGGGSLGCSPDCDERETGAAGFLAMGGTVRPNLLIGGESAVWTKDQDGYTLTMGNVSAVVHYYPNVNGGFFLKGGVGAAVLELGGQGGGSASENGIGGVLGAGFNARVGKNFSLTPYAHFGIGSFDGDVKFNNFAAGLGFVWH